MEPDNVLRLLVVGDSWNEAEALTNRLRNSGYVVRSRHAEDEETVEAALAEQDWELILYLWPLEGLGIQQTLALLVRSRKDIPFLIVADGLEDDEVIAALRAGARDVIPSEPEEYLPLVAHRELESLHGRLAHRACQNALRESERRCRLLLDSSREAISYVHEGVHVYANPAYLSMFGFANPDEVMGVPILDMVAPSQHGKLKDFLRESGRGSQAGDQRELEVNARRTGGGEFPASLEVMPATVEGEPCTQVVVHDLSATADLQQKLRNLSRLDPLTGLYNRQHFLQELEQALDGHPGLLYIELDDFQETSNRIGIAGADKVSEATADLLRDQVGEKGLSARFGEGVFTILVRDRDDKTLNDLAQGICDSVENFIFDAAGVSVTLTCSIGLHPGRLRARDVQVMLARVEAAVGEAKSKGGNRVVAYSPTWDRAEMDEQDWAARLQEALDDDRLRLLYRPVVALHSDDQEETYEVVLRLVDSQGTDIPAEQFLKPAERAGLAGKMDRWAIAHALEVLAEQYRQNRKLRFFLDLSGDTLHDPHLASWIAQRLTATKIPGDALVFQTTEGLASDYIKHVKGLIEALRPLRCEFALTHCVLKGGISHHLKALDVQYFKIDGTLMHELFKNKERQSAVRSINETVHGLGRRSIAESVHDANTLALLWQYGVDYVQGDYLRPPTATLDYDFSGEG